KKNPKTHVAMQRLVMAIEDWYKVIGKKTFFGKRKDGPALELVMDRTARLLGALHNERLVTDAHLAPADLHAEVRRHFSMFFMAYPNWPVAEAYVDSDVFPEMIETVMAKFSS